MLGITASNDNRVVMEIGRREVHRHRKFYGSPQLVDILFSVPEFATQRRVGERYRMNGNDIVPAGSAEVGAC